MVLRTDNTPGCKVDGTGQTGNQSTFNCDTTDPNQANNAGCAPDSNGAGTYGTGFNGAGGGVYATEWTSTGIRIWFFR